MDKIDQFLTGLDKELRTGILPYWQKNMVDKKYGGFYGRIDGRNRRVKDEPRGSILNSRILWTFSAAFEQYKDKTYAETARRGKDYILRHFIDHELGGVYWMVDRKGNPFNTRKQIYALAFAIFGLAKYYNVFREEDALNAAVELYNAIESHSFDPEKNGYLEAYDREWNLLNDLRLSDKDENEKKTMNTHLHILEAYSVLYQVWPDEKLKYQLNNLVRLFLDKMLMDSGHFGLFFDEGWNLKPVKISFGHDIEATWLLCEAADLVAGPDLLQETRKAALDVVNVTLKEGFDSDGALYNERWEDGRLDDDKHWWPQAEAMVGLVNAWELTGMNSYIDQALKVWEFTKAKIIDHKKGEWFFRVNKSGVPYIEEDKAGFWKCPYHNTRACLEIMRRLAKL